MSRSKGQKFRGSCVDCPSKAREGKTQCASCAESLKQKRAQHRKDGQCGDPYCNNPAILGKRACARHARIQVTSERKAFLSHPEQSMWRAAKHRAKQRHTPFSILPEDITIPDRCLVLGIPLVFNRDGHQKGATDQSPSLDCFIPELGYVPGNICVISWRANHLKGNASVHELEKLVLWMQKGGFDVVR
jgi:hypothetical protein